MAERLALFGAGAGRAGRGASASVAEAAEVLVVEGEALELLLVDGLYQLGVDWGEHRLLLRELGIEVNDVFLAFLKFEIESLP